MDRAGEPAGARDQVGRRNECHARAKARGQAAHGAAREGAARGSRVPASDRAGVWGGAPSKEDDALLTERGVEWIAPANRRVLVIR